MMFQLFSPLDLSLFSNLLCQVELFSHIDVLGLLEISLIFSSVAFVIGFGLVLSPMANNVGKFVQGVFTGAGIAFGKALGDSIINSGGQKTDSGSQGSSSSGSNNSGNSGTSGNTGSGGSDASGNAGSGGSNTSGGNAGSES